MKVIRPINNNAVLAVDGNGTEVVVLGRGLAHTPRGGEIDLDAIERTFYEVDQRYVDLLGDLPPEAIELATSLVDLAQTMLSYQLSPNAAFALADHIAFTVDRARKGLVMHFPLTYDVQQQYPVEFKIGEYAHKRIQEVFGVRIPRGESTGVALCLINNIFEESSEGTASQKRAEQVFERVVSMVERDMGVTLERDSFRFARFATHVNYLLQRLNGGENLLDGNIDPNTFLDRIDPEVDACVIHVAGYLGRVYEKELTPEECFYLYLHVARIAGTA